MPTFFEAAEDWRKWLEKNHTKSDELWVGYWKKHTGKPSLTWPESVDEALCFGWIDGLRRRIDEETYQIRFTPRRPRSIWSAVNIERFDALLEAGRMTESGRAAFDKKTRERSKVYAYERQNARLSDEFEKRLQNEPRAARFWSSLPAYYKKVTSHWVMSAKRESTRERRLEALISTCAAEERLPQFESKKTRGK